MLHRETIASLKADVLRWKCRAYSFAAIPFILMIGLQVVTRGDALPVWVVAACAVAMGTFGTLSTVASFDHHKLTGKLVWF